MHLNKLIIWQEMRFQSEKYSEELFRGESLVTKSHGQCNMAYFKSRYRIKVLYFLDEPETALSPKKQLELLNGICQKAGGDN